MVNRAGAGPKPIPHKHLTADNLAEALTQCQQPDMQAAAKVMSESISQEKGSEVGAQSFQDVLPLKRMRCALIPTRAATWRVRHTNIRLSAAAAAYLCHDNILQLDELRL